MGYVDTHSISEKEYITRFMKMLPDAKRGGMNAALRKLLIKMSPFDAEEADGEYDAAQHIEWCTQYVDKYLRECIADFYILRGDELTIFEIDGSHRTPLSKYMAYSNFADAMYGELDVRLVVYDVCADTSYLFDTAYLASMWQLEFGHGLDEFMHLAPKGELLAQYSERKHGFHHEFEKAA